MIGTGTTGGRRVVRARVEVAFLEVGATPGRVAARPGVMALHWCAASRYVVECAFPDSGSDVRWLLGRELLAEGCVRPVGIGDVSVLPDPFTPGVAELVLSTDDGRACLRFCVRDVAGFLDRLVDAELVDVSRRAQPSRPGEGR